MSASSYALLGSVAVHGIVALWLATRPAPKARERAQAPIEFEFFEAAALAPSSLETPQAPEVPEPAQAERHEPAKVTKARPVEASIARVEDSNSAEPSVEATGGSIAPTPAPTPAEARPSDVPPSRGKPMDLSPLAAALTMRDSILATNSCGAAMAGASADCGGARGDSGAGGAKGELGAGPRSLIAMRKEAHLTAEADGSYGYDAPSFRATVMPDGRVTFEDKIHDLNSFVEKHLVGSQINTSEKRRFMASTAALRDQLAAAAEVQNQRRAAVTLQSTLRAVLANAKLNLAQKRANIFGLWDDCASDASGTAAQAAIESFVRSHMPEDGPLAFSTSELAQLNRTRVSRRTFDPYAANDAGVRPG